MSILVSVAVILLAAAFRGVTGFGFALIAMIGLSPFFSASLLAPLVIASDLMVTGLILAERKGAPVDWPSFTLMFVFGIIGAAFGPLFAHAIDDDTAKFCIGLAVLAAALVSMVKKPPALLATPAAGMVASLIVGFLLSAFAAGGPIVVAWLLAKRLAPDRFRGTLALFFGLIDLMTLIMRFAYGTVPDGFAGQLVLFLPVTLAGYLIGLFAVRRMTSEHWRFFTRYGLFFIALIGALRAAVSAFRL
ncbi:sulfite exporter TauE/SafE family protein [Martelella alba]|uniref:sulfite exporter TauE/SafE family protein n=1 Tax=Martelella alba TaxID=2590451 RepID=UPI0015E87347|nr:sulfite exporter TauE/SafE family protein [Martelella alba]